MTESEDEIRTAEPSPSWQISAYPQAPMGAQGLAVLINLAVVGSKKLSRWIRTEFRRVQHRRHGRM